MRTFAVGDIHGCLDEFDELLRVISFKKDVDKLVLLGDLMDRGPDAPGVVRRARELDALCVIGNHDEKHLRWRKHEQRRAATGKKNPMRAMRHPDADAHEKLSEEDFAWLASLPAWLEAMPGAFNLGAWLAVHAGFEPKWSLADQRPDKMLRVRYVTPEGVMKAIDSDVDQPAGTVRWATLWRGQHHVVYGHHATSLKDPQHDVFVDEHGHTWHRFGLDTGCCFGGHLTAMDLDTLAIAQVPAKRKYAELWHGDNPPEQRSENIG